MKQTNQNNTERATRMCRIDIRVTQAQADEIEKQMALCGMNRSEYCRKLITGHKPRKRLSQEELKALNLLADSRAELIHIRNVLKGKPEEFKLQCFRSVSYMQWWIAAVDSVIRRWTDIIKTARLNSL